MLLLETNIKEYPLHAKGKVRDIYDLKDKLLIIATDRISAFDFVLPNGIPDKGKILTQMSLFWFDFVKEIISTHLITARMDDYPKDLRKYEEILEGRSMLVRKAQRIDVECVVRGYMAGSFWKEYVEEAKELESEEENVVIHGIYLPSNLWEAQRLMWPIFTPATKAETLHDENISFEQMEKLTGKKLAAFLKEKSLKIYKKAAAYAEKRGIIIGDTKFEFGAIGEEVILIDELLSPDSSRFWPKETYLPGRSQESFDKQYIRDFLERTGWNKKPPVPHLTAEVILKTQEKYQEAYKRLVSS